MPERIRRPSAVCSFHSVHSIPDPFHSFHSIPFHSIPLIHSFVPPPPPPPRHFPDQIMSGQIIISREGSEVTTVCRVREHAARRGHRRHRMPAATATAAARAVIVVSGTTSATGSANGCATRAVVVSRHACHDARGDCERDPFPPPYRAVRGLRLSPLGVPVAPVLSVCDLGALRPQAQHLVRPARSFAPTGFSSCQVIEQPRETVRRSARAAPLWPTPKRPGLRRRHSNRIRLVRQANSPRSFWSLTAGMPRCIVRHCVSTTDGGCRGWRSDVGGGGLGDCRSRRGRLRVADGPG